MENKRGQITMFIIIGLVILICVGLFFVFQRAKSKEAEILQISTAPVKVYVESCLNEAALPGVYLLASKGGYIYSFDKVLMTEYEQVSYHLEYDEDVAPKREFMEKELSRFIGDSLPLCLNFFEVFDYYDFEFGKIDVETIISHGDIFVKVHYPITIIQKDSKATISVFNADFPIRLGYTLDVKNEIISKISDQIDLDDLSSYGVEVNLLPYDKNTMVYSIYDSESDIDDVPFIFNFAVKSEFIENKVPIIEDIEEEIVYVDVPFNLTIIASDPEGDALTFHDETALFRINTQTGEISFTPTPADTGSYEIPIIVSDGVNEVNRILRLNVTER